MSEFVLGTRYYTVLSDGDIRPGIVTELPARLDDNSFLSTKEAMTAAMTRASDAFENTDSISQRDRLRMDIDRLVNNQKEVADMLRLQSVFWSERWSLLFSREDDKEPLRPIDEEAIPCPGTYFTPGSTVWVPITPGTHNIVSGGWRPERYFVLKTVVTQVSWVQRRGAAGLRYGIDSRYSVDDPNRLCESRKKAVQLLCCIISMELPAIPDPTRVKIFSRADEKKAEKTMLDKIMESANRARA
jgi:hypothetical protein